MVVSASRVVPSIRRSFLMIIPYVMIIPMSEWLTVSRLEKTVAAFGQ